MPEDHAYHRRAALRFVALVSALIFAFSANAFSHSCDSLPGKHTTIAADMCRAGMLTEAMAESDQAVQSPSEAADPYTWYVRGYIYKEYYKKFESADWKSKSRDVAIDAFLKAHEMGYLNENNQKALQYLMTTCYNNALQSASQMQNDEEAALSREVFSRYLLIAQKLGEGEKIKAGEKEFHKTCAQSYYRKWMEDPCSQNYMSACLEETNLALKPEPNDCDLLYNKAVIYYSSVHSCEDSVLTEDEKQKYLQLAAEGLFQAEEYCSANLNIINAMINVQRYLGNDERVKEYESKRSSLIQSSE